MKKQVYIVIILGFILSPKAFTQGIATYIGDEKIFLAETKQVNQFLRRFNCEEDLAGQRLHKDDEFYRNKLYRNKYLHMLFDQQNKHIPKETISAFIKYVTDSAKASFLSLVDKGWFSEVVLEVTYYGKKYYATLFLSIEEENLGYKWVIEEVYFKPFADLFANNNSVAKKFLHPMSHEVEFMNLHRALNAQQDVEQYFDKEFRPDYKTLFLYGIKKNNIKVKEIKNVKFHFFQIDNWYFEVSEFRRNSENSGWLISSLMRISEEEKHKMLRYIYHGN